MPKHNNVCKYCGAKSQIGTICGNCSIKLKLIRKIKRMLDNESKTK